MKQKNAIFLAVMVIIFGVAIAGGTYAWFTASITTTNNTYVAHSDCFLIDYNINNDGNNGQEITGTMFPASGPLRPGSLGGKVTLQVNSACNVNGIGTLTMSVNSNTNSIFGSTVEAHCENPTTLETLNDYKTSSACSTNGGNWVTNGTALKYAVYETDTTGDPVSVGYVTSSMIGGSASIYTDFGITKTAKSYYIYLWLDGYNSNPNADSYTSVSFSGAINAKARQAPGNIPPEYQQVEYIQSSGNQYIDTGIYTNANTRIEIDAQSSNSGTWLFGSRSTGGAANSFGVYLNSTTVYWAQIGGNAANTGGSVTGISVTARHTLDVSGTTVKLDGVQKLTYTNSLTTGTVKFTLLGMNSGNTVDSRRFNGKLYSANIYNGNTLVRGFIPVYNKNTNVIGLYDVVDGGFYTNLGSGSFTKGSNVTSA